MCSYTCSPTVPTGFFYCYLVQKLTEQLYPTVVLLTHPVCTVQSQLISVASPRFSKDELNFNSAGSTRSHPAAPGGREDAEFSSRRKESSVLSPGPDGTSAAQASPCRGVPRTARISGWPTELSALLQEPCEEGQPRSSASPRAHGGSPPAASPDFPGVTQADTALTPRSPCAWPVS